MRTRTYLMTTTVAVAAWLLATCPQLLAAGDEEGFEQLFDGETLAGWDGNPELWSVEDGAITGTSTDEKPISHNEFLIWEGDDVENFLLKLEFRLADRGVGNSGIQYRSKRYPDAGKWVVGGYQADIERTNRYMGILYEERGRGILAEVGEQVVLTESPSGVKKEVVGSLGEREEIVGNLQASQWHDYEIIARGNELTQKINGRTTIHVVDKDSPRAAQRGILALQLHAGPAMQVQFRNIRLKRLESAAEE